MRAMHDFTDPDSPEAKRAVEAWNRANALHQQSLQKPYKPKWIASKIKRLALFFTGYYLIIQAFLAALNICGKPEYTYIFLPLAVLSAWGGHKLIQKAANSRKLLPVPETQRLTNDQH